MIQLHCSSNSSLFVTLSARFAQLLSAFFAADLHNVCSDFDFDGVCIEFVVTDGASFLSHLSISLGSPTIGCTQETI